MSTEKTERKKLTLEEEMTRRQFMKLSGKTLAGLTLSASMLKLLGCSSDQVGRGRVTLSAQPQGLLVVNADRCVGCLRCEAFCTLINDGAVSSFNSRVKVTRNLMSNRKGQGMYANLDKGWEYFPDTCRQCHPAPCAEACPVNAITADANGVKVVNANTCIACGLCTNACPWQMININTVSGKATKCINCNICVERCPTGALTIVAWDAVTAAAQAPWQG